MERPWLPSFWRASPRHLTPEAASEKAQKQSVSESLPARVARGAIRPASIRQTAVVAKCTLLDTGPEVPALPTWLLPSAGRGRAGGLPADTREIS
jgi:hypothetical protein